MPTVNNTLSSPNRRKISPLHHELACACKSCLDAQALAQNSLKKLGAVTSADRGIYGPRGWSVNSGATRLMLQYSDWSWLSLFQNVPDAKPQIMPDYLPYAGGDAWLATRLLDLLSVSALQERQNDAPSLEAILRLTKQHPGQVFFSGYTIGPQRCDERISADTIYVSSELLGIEGKNPLPSQAWLGFAELGLDQLSVPDEVFECSLPVPGWRFWWD